MRNPRSYAGLGVMLGSCLVAPAQAAEEPPGGAHALEVRYEAPPSCPDAAAFFRQVRARTERVRQAEPSEAARTVSVRIDVTPEGSRGELGLPAESAEPFVREVRAETCDEVVLALSLVLALAYDPDARVTFPPEGASAPAGAATAPATPSAGPTPPPAAAPVPPRVAATEEAESWMRFALGWTAAFMSGFAPGWSPVLGPFLEVGARNEAEVLAPRLRLTLLFGPHQEVDLGTRSATLGLLAGRLEGCPVGLSFGPAFQAAPCLALDAGRISAAGAGGVDPAETETRPWGAAWALLSLRFRPTETLFIDAHGGAGVPLVTDDFVLAGPVETVHEVPGALGQAGFAVGVSFL